MWVSKGLLLCSCWLCLDMRVDVFGSATGNRKRAEYCFESTVSEKRAHWVLGNLMGHQKSCRGTTSGHPFPETQYTPSRDTCKNELSLAGAGNAGTERPSKSSRAIKLRSYHTQLLIMGGPRDCILFWFLGAIHQATTIGPRWKTN